MSNELGYLIQMEFESLQNAGYSKLCAWDKIIEEINNLLEKLSS